jgi:glutamate synthase domain-containing protein 2
MSFGSLSRNAKVALARGAEMAGTGICSGEGGSLPAERAENSKYFLEVASAKFGYKEELFQDPNIRACHFKGGQGAKTGTGGHLSGVKVTEEIAAVRNIPVGQDGTKTLGSSFSLFFFLTFSFFLSHLSRHVSGFSDSTGL